MRRYKMTIQEQVSVWQDVEIVIETEDSIEDIEKSLKDGSLLNKYETTEMVSTHIFYDTMDSLDYDYTNTDDLEDIT